MNRHDEPDQDNPARGLAFAFWFGCACWAMVIIVLVLIFGCASPSSALSPVDQAPVDQPPVSSPQPTGQQVAAPAGFISFCLRDAPACTGGTDRPEAAALTPVKWATLNAVNDYANRLPQIDDEVNYDAVEYWTPAGERGGDCEDFALLKRNLLLARGWPASALLLATAEQWNGDRHVVLIVATDRGDYVLDNLNREIVPWLAAPYVWEKRQSPARPFVWVDLDSKTFRAETNGLPTIGEPPFVAAARSMKQQMARMQ